MRIPHGSRKNLTKTANPLQLALADVLGKVGFLRKGDSWFRAGDEVIEVLNLQKSQYGRQYYLNYGLWLRALGEAAFPKEETCHIRLRADMLVAPDADLTQLLDLETSVADDERRTGFARLLAEQLLPFAEGCRTGAGLRLLLAAGAFKKAMVHTRARALLLPPTE